MNPVTDPTALSGTQSAPQGPATTIPENDIIYIPYVLPAGNGAYCVTFTEEIGPNISASPAGQNGYFSILLIGIYGLCPNAVVPAVVAADPTVLASQFWQTIPLPVPRPAIPPGYAITGLPAYLVTNGTVAPASWTDATPLGPLVVTAHGKYQVDWGDGSRSGPFESEGLAFPNGTIEHTYDTVGTVTVTVTEQWTATWTLGAAGGTLRQLRTTANIPAFAIRQVQAVLTH